MKKDDKKEKEKLSTKKIIKRIVIVMSIIMLAVIVISLLPFLYFILVVLYSMFIDVPAKPKIKEGDFPFELVYEYKGKQVTIRDTISCEYEGLSWSLDGGNSRDWDCEFENDDEYGHYYIDIENEPDLFIVVPYAADYYMGDKEYSAETALPYIRYDDESTGTYYEEFDKVDVVDIKIVEWKPSAPLKGNIK